MVSSANEYTVYYSVKDTSVRFRTREVIQIPFGTWDVSRRRGRSSRGRSVPVFDVPDSVCVSFDRPLDLENDFHESLDIQSRDVS